MTSKAVLEAPGRPLAAAFVASSADEAFDVGLHEELQDRLGTVAQEVAKLHLDHTPRWPPKITPAAPMKLHHVLGR